jgi:hypothetical protein
MGIASSVGVFGMEHSCGGVTAQEVATLIANEKFLVASVVELLIPSLVAGPPLAGC